jgi:hypothetical protein
MPLVKGNGEYSIISADWLLLTLKYLKHFTIFRQSIHDT